MNSENKQVALVTGASRGIGEAIARELAEAGYLVACTARSVEAIEALAKDIGGLAVPFDLMDAQATRAGIERIEAELGPIDILVNNAGVAASAPIDQVSDEEWDRIMQINVTAGFRLTQACVPGMIERGWGRVIFIASNAGLRGYAYTAAYCASKHAVIGLTRSLSEELARTGITVNAICPGFVETDMARDAIDRIEQTTSRDQAAARKALERMNPQNRLIQVDEIAHLTTSLVAHGARGINGQAIAVDGGQVMH
jgi:NAD(P)-dependent dehydrogenase (short-subunit alcohol dehydrogenase family)